MRITSGCPPAPAFTAAAFAVVLPVVGSAALAPTAAAAECTDVDVVFARGTSEPAGIGRVGQALADDCCSRNSVAARSASTANYPATYDFLAAADGAADATNHIVSTAAQCPSTKSSSSAATRRAPPSSTCCWASRRWVPRWATSARPHRFPVASPARWRRWRRSATRPPSSATPSRRPAARSPARASTCATTAIRSAHRGANRSRTPITRPPMRWVRRRDSSPAASAAASSADRRPRKFVYHGGMRVQRAFGSIAVAACAAAVALLVPAVLPSGAPGAAPAARAAECPPIEVIFARGRIEPPGPGAIGSAFVKCAALQGRSEHQPVRGELPGQHRGRHRRQRHEPAHPAHGQELPEHQAGAGRLFAGAAATDMVLALPIPIGFQEPAAQQRQRQDRRRGVVRQRNSTGGSDHRVQPGVPRPHHRASHAADPICSPTDTWQDNWPDHLAAAYIQARMVSRPPISWRASSRGARRSRVTTIRSAS